MGASEYSAVVALAAVVGKVSYGWAKHWWTRKTLREIYIGRASAVQLEIEDAPDDIISEYDDSPPDEKPVTVKHRGSFRNYLVRCGQAKFGCPVRNEANRLTVRKYLYDLCVERKLIARHIVDHLDIATELVFVPSRNQIIAAAIRHTELSQARNEVHRSLTGRLADVA